MLTCTMLCTCKNVIRMEHEFRVSVRSFRLHNVFSLTCGEHVKYVIIAEIPKFMVDDQKSSKVSYGI